MARRRKEIEELASRIRALPPRDQQAVVRQVLTPEQRPKFEDLLRRMDQERKEREEKGRGR